MNWLYLVVLGAGGGIGGFVASIRTPTSHSIRAPFTQRQLHLGFLGDVLIGFGAALAAFAFLSIIPCSADQTANVQLTLKLLGAGIVAGYAGTKVLDRASFDLLHAKQVELTQAVQARGLIEEAREFLIKHRYKLAADGFRRALDVDPANSEAKINLAVSLNYEDPTNHEEPVRLLNAVLADSPESSKALYNRACIKALNLDQYTIDEVLADLRGAIKLEGAYGPLATYDDDFTAIEQDPRFCDLVGIATVTEGPRDVKTETNGVPGRVVVSWKGVLGVRNYEVQYTPDPSGATGWMLASKRPRESRLNVDGLANGVGYAFRVRGLGIGEPGPWSDPVQQTAV